MKKKTIVAFVMLVVLLVSLFGTAGAQSGTTPEETPTATATPPAGSKFFTHPVVKMLSAYFDQDSAGETPVDPAVTPSTDPADPAVTPAVDPSATPETGSGLGPIGEEIAAYHEQGMGFGVLVKLYAMVKASEEACAGQTPDPSVTPDPNAPAVPACTPLTADQLVTEFKGGAGMGKLFQEYGKPALLGVGHVKKELKKQAQATVEATAQPGDPQVTPDDHKGNGKDKDKDNGNGKEDKGPKNPKK